MNKENFIKTILIGLVLMLLPYKVLSANDFQGDVTMYVGDLHGFMLPDNVYNIVTGSTASLNTCTWRLENNDNGAVIFTNRTNTNCNVKAVKPGSRIKLTYEGDCILNNEYTYRYSGYYYIYVFQKVLVEEIKLTPSALSMQLDGPDVKIEAEVLPINATNKSVSWSTSNSSVATVSSSGEVKAKAAGTATITCKANDGSGVTDTCRVSVKGVEVTDISLDHSVLTMSVNDTRRLSTTISPDDASDKSLIWSSSDESVAKMGTIWSTSAEVNAVGPGKAIITCAANDGSGVKATCEIRVTKVKSGDFFTAKTIEGVEMKFMSNNVQSGKCGVSRKVFDEPAVSPNTTGSVTIPEEVEYMKVTTIYNNAFDDCKGITKIIIPNSVETIESWAFHGCEGLKSMTIPDNVIKFGLTVFGDCTSLESVSLGKGITRIEDGMFHSCTALTSITGLEQIVYVGNNAFLGTPWLANQPDGLVYVGKVLVKYNGTMPENTKITIKEGTAMIGGRTFEDQMGLVGINIPESVTAIGEGAFSSCENLRSVVIPSQVTEIGSFAFSYCTGLKSIVSLIEEPMAISKYVFSCSPENYIFENATLYVPTGTKTLYENTEGWKLFSNIIEGEPEPEPGPGLKGDVNGDGQVNGTDYVALVNIVLGKSEKTAAADVNSDGQVNGTDYVALVNIVLGRSNVKAMTRAAGATELSIDPSFDIKAGETKELVINLKNQGDEITLVQFDLRLPDGLSVKQTGGEYEFDIAGRTDWRKHSFNANNQANGSIRFLLSSNSNAVLTGNEGAIITMTLVADNNFTRGDIRLENILLVTPEEKETKQSDYVYPIGSDIPTPKETGLSVPSDFSIAAGEEKEMVIELTNPDDEITLVQFELRLPDGLSVKQTAGEYEIDIAGRTTLRKHSLDANKQADGSIRFLLSSNSNAVLSGTEGAIISVKLKAESNFDDGSIRLDNILLVTPDEKEIKQTGFDIKTGIIGIASDATSASPIYSITGLRLTSPRKGINIIGGKKVIVR